MARLPKTADAYVAAIGPQNAAAMLALTYKGVLQGGRLGDAKQPNFQVIRPDGTVLRYRAVDGRAESDGFAKPYAPQHLSEPLNDALRASVPVDRVKG